MKTKLTPAQKILLQEVAEGCGYCVPSYIPGRRLVGFGLCVWFAEDWLDLTDASRKHLGIPAPANGEKTCAPVEKSNSGDKP